MLVKHPFRTRGQLRLFPSSYPHCCVWKRADVGIKMPPKRKVAKGEEAVAQKASKTSGESTPAAAVGVKVKGKGKAHGGSGSSAAATSPAAAGSAAASGQAPRPKRNKQGQLIFPDFPSESSPARPLCVLLRTRKEKTLSNCELVSACPRGRPGVAANVSPDLPSFIDDDVSENHGMRTLLNASRSSASRSFRGHRARCNHLQMSSWWMFSSIGSFAYLSCDSSPLILPLSPRLPASHAAPVFPLCCSILPKPLRGR